MKQDEFGEKGTCSLLRVLNSSLKTQATGKKGFPKKHRL
jgi:hypothetical protein